MCPEDCAEHLWAMNGRVHPTQLIFQGRDWGVNPERGQPGDRLNAGLAIKNEPMRHSNSLQHLAT